MLASESTAVPEELYLASYPDGKYQVQVSSGGAVTPQFSSDGRKLYYVGREDKYLHELSLEDEGGRLTVSGERKLFAIDGQLAGTVDGSRFIIVRTRSAPPRWPYFVSDWRSTAQ